MSTATTTSPESNQTQSPRSTIQPTTNPATQTSPNAANWLWTNSLPHLMDEVPGVQLP
jgi:hypothetical protein